MFCNSLLKAPKRFFASKIGFYLESALIVRLVCSLYFRSCNLLRRKWPQQLRHSRIKALESKAPKKHFEAPIRFLAFSLERPPSPPGLFYLFFLAPLEPSGHVSIMRRPAPNKKTIPQCLLLVCAWCFAAALGSRGPHRLKCSVVYASGRLKNYHCMNSELRLLESPLVVIAPLCQLALRCISGHSMKKPSYRHLSC